MIRRYVVLAVFLMLLGLPLFQMVTGAFPQMELRENRRPVPAPAFTGFRDVHKYIQDCIAWFDDHYGFRAILIRIKTQVDVSIFGVSDKIHIGDNGWLFYRSVMDQQKPTIESALSEPGRREAVVSGTMRLAKQLARRNVLLIVSIMPMKDVFYGDHLPRHVGRLRAPTQIDTLEERLKNTSDIMYLDATGMLREIAKYREVFHHTDFHWNDPAGFEVAQHLVDGLGQLEGRQLPIWTHELEIGTNWTSGGEANFLPLFYPPHENALMVKQTWATPPRKYIDKYPPYTFVMVKDQPNEAELAPMVVLGDSFFDAMLRSGIDVYFRKIYRAHWNSTNLKTVVDHLPTDCRYLFLEFIEVNLSALNALANWPEE